ncbi:hypothetical protein QTP88_016291 [Uroleucon formosanum]
MAIFLNIVVRCVYSTDIRRELINKQQGRGMWGNTVTCVLNPLRPLSIYTRPGFPEFD